MTKIKIINAIIQYPNLFEARAYQDGKPTFSARILLNKTDHADTINEIKALLKTICNDNKITVKPDSFKCFKDGETTGNDQYNDYYILNAKASETFPPKVVGGDLKPFTDEVRSGDIANIVVSFWHYSNISKGIACNLKAIQITGENNSNFITNEEVNIEETFAKVDAFIEKQKKAKQEQAQEDFDSLDQDIPF